MTPALRASRVLDIADLLSMNNGKTVTRMTDNQVNQALGDIKILDLTQSSKASESDEDVPQLIRDGDAVTEINQATPGFFRRLGNGLKSL